MAKEHISRVHAANYGVLMRARKVWLTLNREGIEVMHRRTADGQNPHLSGTTCARRTTIATGSARPADCPAPLDHQHPTGCG